MDIPAPHLPGFFPRRIFYVKTTAIQWCNAPLLTRCFIRPNSGKSAPAFFLNCTKNTELTRTHFTRTVSLAPQEKKRSGRVTGWHRIQQFTQPDTFWGRRHMKSREWKTYRTRFLVKAKQLSSTLSFVDHLGRQHCGRKGDYLVESSDGVISIAPRNIFEDIYVALSHSEREIVEARAAENFSGLPLDQTQRDQPPIDRRRQIRALDIQDMTIPPPTARHPIAETRTGQPNLDRYDESPSARRKLLQPCRDRTSPSRAWN